MSSHLHRPDGDLVPDHRAPSDCPVCGEHLIVTRLGCTSCGTELAGIFAPCEFCSLSAAELDMLRVFLAARGNLREVEKHLGVSYPTARLRFTELLQKMGLVDAPPGSQPAAAAAAEEDVDEEADEEAEEAEDRGTEPAPSRDQILAEVASGALTPAEAGRLLR